MGIRHQHQEPLGCSLTQGCCYSILTVRALNYYFFHSKISRLVVVWSSVPGRLTYSESSVDIPGVASHLVVAEDAEPRSQPPQVSYVMLVL